MKITYFFILMPISLVLLVFTLKVLFHLSVESFSGFFFHSLLNGNFLLLVLIFFSLFALLTANLLFLKTTIYRINLRDFDVLMILGKGGPSYLRNGNILYILLELKLIFRNKRIFGFFILAIGFLFLFYNTLMGNQYGLYFSFIIYIFINGIFGYIFSQYMFSWESSYFDFLFSTNFDLPRYIKSKYIIYVVLGLIVFISVMPLILQGKIDIHLFITAVLFNSCVGYFILFYMATFNTTRIDLNRNIFFNLEGNNNTQMAAILIIIVAPVLLLFGLLCIFNTFQSLLVINIISIISLMNYKKWFNIIFNKLQNRKYINLEGYRND